MRDWIIGALGAVVGAALIALPVYLSGISHGRKLERAAALELSIKADNSRRKIDAEVSSRPAADLCRSLGLRVDAINECMRRIQQANP